MNRRFGTILKNNGDKKAIPVNRRNMLSKAISNDGNSTMGTFLSIVEVGGRILVEWED